MSALRSFHTEKMPLTMVGATPEFAAPRRTDTICVVGGGTNIACYDYHTSQWLYTDMRDPLGYRFSFR